MRHSESGITLLETVIIFVIIGILAALATPYYIYNSTRAYQKEAIGMLKQIYVMQRAYFVKHDHFYVPPDGNAASAANPTAFQALHVEIIGIGRYTYTIVDDNGGFIARAIASDLDQDPIVDEWTIDNMGLLVAQSDDALN